MESFFLRLMRGTDRTPISLLRDSRWQSVIRDWGEAHRQRDVCEFFAHLMNKSDCRLFAGLWKAFTPTMAGNYHLLDEGPCTQPIILHLPQATRTSTPPRIQRLVDEWHRCVDRIHGLHQVPPARFFLTSLFQFRFYKKPGQQLIPKFTSSVLLLSITATHRSRDTTLQLWCRMDFGAVTTTV